MVPVMSTSRGRRKGKHPPAAAATRQALADYVREVVDRLPALTNEQRAKAAAALREPSRADVS